MMDHDASPAMGKPLAIEKIVIPLFFDGMNRTFHYLIQFLIEIKKSNKKTTKFYSKQFLNKTQL